MTSFADLPEDVVYDILCGLPDFASLATAIQVSKNYTYSVFQEHKRVILYTVAVNLIGVCLPHALKLFRHIVDDAESGDALSTGTLMDALTSLTRDERRQLEDSLQVVATLEALFSQTRKDRRSKESVLTRTESTRFRVAMYRIWNLHMAAATPQVDDDFEEDILDGLVEEWCTERIKAVLTHYNKSELSDVFCAAQFTCQVSVWASRAAQLNSRRIYTVDIVQPGDGHDSFVLLGRPDIVINRYLLKDDPSSDISESDIRWLFFSNTVSSIFDAENYGQSVSQVQDGPNLLVDKIHDANDTCFKCGEVHGVNLYGRSNWHLMRDHAPVPYLCGGLEGNLSRNTTEVTAIIAYFRRGWDDSPRRLFDWATFVEEVFDIANEEVGGDEIWDKAQWYCKGCMGYLLRSRLRRWWIAKKVKENIPFKPGCWYGYDCRTQRHKDAHAEKLNHLCGPTRGDTVMLPEASSDAAPPEPLGYGNST